MRKMILQCGVLALSLLAANVMAAVSPDEANKLGTSLTPLGAEKAGNADGSIPAWTGGIPKNAGAVDSKGFLADPFANEKPLFTITAANVDKYKGQALRRPGGDVQTLPGNLQDPGLPDPPHGRRAAGNL